MRGKHRIFMQRKRVKTSRKLTQLDELIRTIKSDPNDDKKVEALIGMRDLCMSDPSCMNRIMDDSELLMEKVQINGDFVRFAHCIPGVLPKESLELFERSKQHPELYLPIVRAYDSRGLSVSSVINMRIIEHDDIAYSLEALKKIYTAKVVNTPGGAEVHINMKEGHEFKSMLVDAVRDMPLLDEMFLDRIEGKTVAAIWSDTDYLNSAFIDITRKKPFFASMLRRDSGGSCGNIALEFALVPGQAERLLDALEQDVPARESREILGCSYKFRNGDNINVAFAILNHGSLVERFSKYIADNRELSSISDEEIVISGTRLSISEAIGISLSRGRGSNSVN